MDAERLEVLGDRILLEPIEAEKESEGGIILPQNAEQEQHRGKVIAAGEGRYTEAGDRRIPLDVEAGDEVLYSKWGGSPVSVNGTDYVLVRESDILARVAKG